MNENQLAALLMAQAAGCICETMGMHAENMQRQAVGSSMAYVETDFQAVLNRWSVGWNDAIMLVQGRTP